MGGVESDYSVCPRPLLQFFQFFQFMLGYVRLCQVTSGYVSLRWRDGTWSSTIVSVHIRSDSFFSFFQFLQFRSVSLSQVTSGYVRLHQVTSVYVGGTGRGARQ